MVRGRNSKLIKLYNYTDGAIATLTKCLNDKGLPARQQYVDVNNCPWAMDLIKQYNFGEPTGEEGRSGYCVYPIVEFDIEELKKHMMGVID